MSSGALWLFVNSSAYTMDRVMKSIDVVLHLSNIFGMSQSEPGILVVEFIFSIVW